jgi:hypothetical protein
LESSSYTLLRGEDGGYKLHAMTMGDVSDEGAREPEDGADGE